MSMTTSDAIAVLNDGIAHVYRIQPEDIREPVKQVLRVALGQCEARRHSLDGFDGESTLGLPINYALEIAIGLKEGA